MRFEIGHRVLLSFLFPIIQNRVQRMRIEIVDICAHTWLAGRMQQSKEVCWAETQTSVSCRHLNFSSQITAADGTLIQAWCNPRLPLRCSRVPRPNSLCRLLVIYVCEWFESNSLPAVSRNEPSECRKLQNSMRKQCQQLASQLNWSIIAA